MKVHRKPGEVPAFGPILNIVEQSLVAALPESHVDLNLCWNTLRAEAPDAWQWLLERPCVTVETPLMGRKGWKFWPDNGKGRRNYYRLAMGDPTVLYGGFRWPGCPSPERWLRLCENIEIDPEVRPSPESGRHIIYAMQTQNDASVKGLRVMHAAVYDLWAIRQHTNLPIVLCPHPQTWKGLNTGMRETDEWDNLMNYCREAGVRVSTGEERTFQFFEDARCLVCHSSGVAFEAFMAGIPIVTLHAGNFMAPVSAISISRVETVRIPNNRYTHLHRLAYCQWNFDELKNGEAVNWLMND